jgi:putative hemolysin
MSDVLLELLVIVLLVLVEAVFVAAEIALITIRRSRVEQLIDEGRRGALRLRRLTEDPGRLLAVVQIAVTFVGFFSSAYAAVNLMTRLESLFLNVPVLREVAGGSALVVVTILLAAFTIVFAELVPKTLALAHTDRFAIVLAGPVDLLGRILGPVVSLLTWLTRVIAAGFGADVQTRAQISTEELKLIVERGGEEGILEAEEEQMISAVIGLGDRRVHEVMVPRTDMSALPVTATLDEAIDTIIAEGHSRIPVYEGTIDQVVGILYAKDLLPFLKGEDKRPDLRMLLRQPLFVPESMSIDDLLHQLQRRKVHIAIALDEYGGTAGLVTIEDLLEEIVGEIQDEYDVEEPMTVKLSDDEARVDGRASVDDLAEMFDFDLEELEDYEEYDTVGGLIYHRIGGVPQPGDKVDLDAQGLTLTVESTDGNRVGKVLAVHRRRENRLPGDDDGERQPGR